MNKKTLVFKIILGLSGLFVTIYLGISAYAAQVLLTPKPYFDAKKAQVFANPPIQVELLANQDGVKIKGWFIKSNSSNQSLILVHGMNSSRTSEFGGHFTEFAAAMQRQGFNILMIDLRGHGESGGSHITFGLTEKRDVIGAVNWLKNKGFKTGKIGVLGVSMGSAVAIYAASEDSDIAALVLDSGYAAIYPIIQSHWKSASGLPDIFLPSTMMFGYLMTGVNIAGAEPVKEINKLAARPILIIHSLNDNYTPVKNAYDLKRADPQDLTSIPVNEFC